MQLARPVQDRSITLLAGSQSLFPAIDADGCVERFVHNPHATNSIAINLTGGTAALNTAGSITIAPGGFWSGRVSSAITVIGTTGSPVTAGSL